MERYDRSNVKVFGQKEKLPTGGYICKIIDAEEMRYSWGSVLIIDFDIAQGEHSGFFIKDYESNNSDNKAWKGRYRLNLPNGTSKKADKYRESKIEELLQAVESSNKGYIFNWDESTLVGKLVGLVFGEEEWEMDGRSGMTVKAQYAICTSKALDAKVPSPKYKKETTTSNTAKVEEEDNMPF